MRYKVTDMSGNVSDEAVRTINVLPEGPAGLGDVLNIDAIMKVYPNPSHGLFNLELLSKQSGDVTIQVLDMMGKEIGSTRIAKDNLSAQTIDLRNAAQGVYFLKVETGDKVYMKKIQVN